MSMSTDDLFYIIILVGSIPFGLYVKEVKGAQTKQKLCTGVGAAVVLTTCGLHSLHSVITTLVTCGIVKFTSIRYCHWLSFVWCFGYLVFFRTCHIFGIPSAPPLANAVQLLLTLKMVMVAFEVHESHYPLKERRDADHSPERLKELRKKYVNVNPGFVDIIHYAYCYIGLLTGPFYRYRTYHDMLYEKNGPRIPWKDPLVNRIKYIPVIIVSFLVFSHYFDKDYTQTEDFLDRPLWFRAFFIVPMFIIFRTRLYVAFLLSEGMCMTAGLGAYPSVSKPRCGQGPTDLDVLDKISDKTSDVDYNFDTIYNLDIYGCELASTSREGLKSWNMTVQSWLAHCVYKRFPIRSLGSTVTMTVSAFWHGIHPGYYLSFLTCVPILMAEDIWINLYYKNASQQQQRLFNWICWFFKMRFFDYMCMGFILLSWQATVSYWYSIYFLIHIIIAAFLISGYYLQSRRHKKVA